MTNKERWSPHFGPQEGEPACDGNEHITDATNSAAKTDNDAWEKNQHALKKSADRASLNAYPRK